MMSWKPLATMRTSQTLKRKCELVQTSGGNAKLTNQSTATWTGQAIGRTMWPCQILGWQHELVKPAINDSIGNVNWSNHRTITWTGQILGHCKLVIANSSYDEHLLLLKQIRIDSDCFCKIQCDLLKTSSNNANLPNALATIWTGSAITQTEIWTCPIFWRQCELPNHQAAIRTGQAIGRTMWPG